MKNFSVRLRELRIEKGLSQQKLADAIGIKRHTVADWELRRTEPDISYIISLARFFDITTDVLLGIKEY